jgi:hypothetical protein
LYLRDTTRQATAEEPRVEASASCYEIVAGERADVRVA